MEVTIKSKFTEGTKVSFRGPCDSYHDEVAEVFFDNWKNNFRYKLKTFKGLFYEYELEEIICD